ncbi:MAG: methyltransferase domain-containing protein [Planctomycetes bacterium]|nr:methyltransferase domain-containing protein [Planctomycetota bacterium]
MSTKAYLNYLRTVREPTPLIVRGRTFTVLPGVFLPGSGSLDYFFQHLPLKDGRTLLEIGTGHGILPLLYAIERDIQGVGTDLLPEAILCARLNANRHGVTDRVDFRQGDLFQPLRRDERFDVVFWNTTVFGEKPVDDMDRAVTSENYESLDRYLREGRSWLRPGGSLCVGFTVDADPTFLKARIAEYRYDIQAVSSLEKTREHPLIYVLRPR